ncbi:MAG: cytochrome c assembly protein, partial [Saprospiraceae bacterium]
AEEKTTAREFWMLIGALVLLFSALLITGATSLPVWNKLVQIFDPKYVGAALKDPIEHHNRYQLWIAVFIGMLSGLAQFTRYNERNWSGHSRKFLLHLGIAAAGAAVLTVLNAQWINVKAWQLYFLLFAAMFTVVANLDYLISGLKGNWKLAGSVISHVGFGALVLGSMSTGLDKAWISSNAFAMDGLIEGMGNDDLKKNVILMKEAAMPIKDHFEATYLRDTIERQTRTFTVNFKKRDQQGNYTGETFTVQPNIMYDRQFTKVVASNPSTQHYWNYDIFTTVSSLPKAELDPEYAKQQEDSLRFEPYEAVVGDTIFTKKHYLVVEGITKQPQHPDYHAEKGDLAFGLRLKAYAMDQPQGFSAAPMLYFRPGKGAFTLATQIGQLQMKVRLTEASMEQLLKAEDALQYRQFQVQPGDDFLLGEYKIHFNGADREIKNSAYVAEPNDIAVAADLEITGPNGQKFTAAPVYLIRDNQQLSLKDEVPALGLHFRFENIDPKKGVLTLGVAQSGAGARTVPLEIAENAARSDYIVLEAIVFPGIKLVWIGAIMMMLGLAFSLVRRMISRTGKL